MSKFFDDSDIVKESSEGSFFDQSDIIEEQPMQAEGVSPLTALGLGAASGITAGFSDELFGAGSALTSLPQTGFDKEKLLQEYRSARDRARALEKQAFEESPTAATTGALSGGLASLLVPAGLATRALGAGKGLLGAARSGATLGAVSGVGASEGETLEEIASDAATGATFGAGLGATFPLAGSAIRGAAGTVKGAVDIATSIPTVSSTIKGFQQGVRGQSVSGEKAFERIGQEALDLSEELGLKLSETGSDLAKRQAEILRAAEGKTSVNISDLISSLSDEAQEVIPAVGSKAKSDIKTLSQAQKDIITEFGLLPDEKKLLEQAPQFADQILEQGSRRLETTSPTITNKVKKALSGLSGVSSQADVPELQTAAGQQLAGSKAKEITNRLYTALPELGETNKLISEFNSAMSSVGAEAVNNRLIDAKDAMKLRKTFFNIIRTADGSTDRGIISKDAVNELSEVLKKVNPELEQEVIPKIKDVAERLDLSRQSIGSGNLVGAILSLGGRTVVGGEVAGRATKSAIDGIASMTPSQVQDLAKLVATKGGETASRLSEKLMGLSGADTQGKKAALFALMQQPEFRRILEEQED